jgi:hypothetical protein
MSLYLKKSLPFTWGAGHGEVMEGGLSVIQQEGVPADADKDGSQQSHNIQVKGGHW